MILVGVDFSEGSAGAVELARDLASEHGGPICFVHVGSSLTGTPLADASAVRWLGGLHLDAADVEVRRGVPWLELVRLAQERGVTMVITGTHGRSGFQPLRLGRTAAQVALRSMAPVVLVPARRRAHEPAMAS